MLIEISEIHDGGQSISLSHLAPFVQVSREKFRKEVREELTSAGMEFTDEKVNEIAEKRVVKEVEHGVQTIQYQVTTLMTTNGGENRLL